MDMIVDGVPITVEVDGNYLLIPTEDGIERVCISEFDVELIDGNLMLVHEVNPLLTSVLISLGISELFKLVFRTAGHLCWWCSTKISAAGLLLIPIAKKISTSPKFWDEVMTSAALSIAPGIALRMIAATALIIGTCGNVRCVFHRSNH